MEKLKKHLQEKSLPEITQFINWVNPDQELKTLKCKKKIAINRAVELAQVARNNRNREKYRKISRRLRVFCI